MLQKAIELGENSSRAYGLLGYCHLLRKNALAGENAYRQAYLLDPIRGIGNWVSHKLSWRKTNSQRHPV